MLTSSSAGIGRTGTFISLMSLLYPGSDEVRTFVPLKPVKENDEVLRLVDGLRDYRKSMVQTPEQLQLVYQVVAEATSR